MTNIIEFAKALGRAKNYAPRLELRLRLISVLYPELRDPDEEAAHYNAHRYRHLLAHYRRQSKSAHKTGDPSNQVWSEVLEVRASEIELLIDLLHDLTHDQKLAKREINPVTAEEFLLNKYAKYIARIDKRIFELNL